jgi:DNA processing protein
VLFESTNSKDSLVLAWLSTVINLSNSRILEILSVYSSLYEATRDKFSRIVTNKKTWLEKYVLKDSLDLELSKFSRELEDFEVKYITILDDDFPFKFKILGSQPVVLYYQGDITLCSSKELITVVGSRMYSSYADLVINKVLNRICDSGIGVVSGLALGIDSLAHKIALEKNAKTIAVIGSGLDSKCFYPKENSGLKKQIIDSGGLVLSEYPPKTPANVYNFPRRNRLLAALTEITWVVQASRKSGSLITASIAQDLGKTVATTPGSILENSLSGNLLLLKSGASIITEPEDVFDLMGLKVHPEIKVTKATEFNSNGEKEVYTRLLLSPQVVESIAELAKLQTVEVMRHLSMLELIGLARNLGNNEWVRVE